MKRGNLIILLLIVLLVLGIRLYLSFQIDFLQGDESYLRLRQVEHIKQTLKPLSSDGLSFSGRTRIGSPLFDYLIAFLSLFFGKYFGKILPNLFSISLIPIVYFITQKITQNNYVSLLTAFISGFIPIYFISTLNTLSIYSLIIPLMCFLIYSYLRVTDTKWLYIYIITLGIYCFLHPTVILFLLGLLFYLLLMKLENLKIKKQEIEITLFSVFLVLWSQFFIYKNILLSSGPLVIWQNIPKQILAAYFSQITIFNIVLWAGIIPFTYGLFIIWKYIFQRKNKDIYFLIGFALSTGLILWIKLIQLKIGLIFFGTILVLLFGVYYKTFIDYLLTTQIAKWLPLFKVTIVISFILTSTIPSIILAQQNIISDSLGDELVALSWLAEHSPKNAVILGSVSEGHLISAITKRKNIIDSDFLNIKDSDVIFNDVKTIYTSPYETSAIELLDKYSVDYIIFSPTTKKSFQIDKFSLIKDERCFDEVYDEDQIRIYKPLCHVR